MPSLLQKATKRKWDATHQKTPPPWGIRANHPHVLQIESHTTQHRDPITNPIKYNNSNKLFSFYQHGTVVDKEAIKKQTLMISFNTKHTNHAPNKTVAMAGLRKKIEALMSAISFAEEGEFETAKTMMKTRKRVLLALRNNRIDHKTCTYAINTCKRIGIDLDLLVVGNEEKEALTNSLQPFMSQLNAENVSFSLVRKTGCLKQAILDHIEESDNILFVVIESQGSLNSNCSKDRHLSDAWQQLQCPLVVVAEGAKA